ncbi:MAG TPA: hypothetical protein VKM54_19240 [Myxococcota bacterium]|nr:hypothetical protein [Myxococcota bacterium]
MRGHIAHDDPQLFSEKDLADVLDEQRKGLLREIETCELENLTDQLLDERVEYYSAEAPQLSDRITREGPRETTLHIVEVGREVKTPAWEFTFVIPFTGDPRFFGYRPRMVTGLPCAQVALSSLRLTIVATDPIDVKQIEALFDRELDAIRKMVNALNAETKECNGLLKPRARDVMDARRARLARAEDAASGMRYPRA